MNSFSFGYDNEIPPKNEDSDEAVEPSLRNDFILYLTLRNPFINNAMQTELCKENFKIIEIISDYDERSAHSVCSYIMKTWQECFVYPLSKLHVVIFTGALPNISQIKRICKLDLVLLDDNRTQEYLTDYYHHFKRALTYAICVQIQNSGWFSLHIDNREDISSEGVYARFTTNESSKHIESSIKYIESIFIKNITFSSSTDDLTDGVTAILSFETSCYKITSLLLHPAAA
eukprot:gene4794-9558_t